MAPNTGGPDDIWFRVDDRLIHGQVTVGWRQYLRYAEIWVVDDVARGDPYLQDALRLAAPEGVAVRVLGVEEAVACRWPPPAPSEWRPSPVMPTDADGYIGRRTHGGEEEAPSPVERVRARERPSSPSPVFCTGEGWGGGWSLNHLTTEPPAAGE